MRIYGFGISFPDNDVTGPRVDIFLQAILIGALAKFEISSLINYRIIISKINWDV